MKPTILRHLLSIALLISAYTLTYSQSLTTNSGARQSTSGEREWELIAAYYLGGAHTASTDLLISQPALRNNLTFQGVDLEGRSFGKPLYYGFRAGFFPRRSFPVGIEIEFTHLKVYADSQQSVAATGELHGNPLNRQIPLGDLVQAYSVSHGVNLLLVNGVVRHSFARSHDWRRDRFIVAGRIGVGPTIPHTESAIEGQHQEQYETGALALQFSAGGEMRLWRGLYLMSEYKFTRTRQSGKVFMGTAEALLKTQHGVIGLSYHF